MRRWRLGSIALGSKALYLHNQLGNLPLQRADLAPLAGDRIVQFGNCLVLMRNEDLQSVEAGKIRMSIAHAELHCTLRGPAAAGGRTDVA